MEEEINYAILSNRSTDKPIVNLGDITAGLRTTLSGNTIKDGTRYNVSVSLPQRVASNTTSNRNYHFAIQEFVDRDIEDWFTRDFANLLERFNRLLDYLENWIDDGNLNMSDLKQYVNQEE